VNQQKQEVKENNYVEITPNEDIHTFHCDFRNLGENAGLAPGSVDLLFVDPPYARTWLKNWIALGEFAAKFLKNGALLIAYAPVCYLPACQDALAAHWITSGWDVCRMAQGNQDSRAKQSRKAK